MINPPMVNTDVLEHWRYMNECNPDGTRTPLSRADVTRLFAYIQLLEERITAAAGKVLDLKEYLGLGTGSDGTGIPDRREVRKRLRALERRKVRREVEEQHNAWLGMLPLYTARFEQGHEWEFIASIDEMPGVYAQGHSLAACMRSLAACVRSVVEFEKKHGHERFENRSKRRTRQSSGKKLSPAKATPRSSTA